ncbi:MAG: hypothetical protein IJY69_01290 [Clostridia bacterium]|nr:hypothetical protein [Clostridia bacterium]
MSDELDILKSRCLELAKKSHGSGIYLFTDFLGLSEQSALREIGPQLQGYICTEFGGVEGAERVMVRFGDPDQIPYDAPFPIQTLLIAPIAPKFAEKLSHRDYLGALMNLGIERGKLGDIVQREGCAYLFTREEIADYIRNNLTRVRHTDVKVTLVDGVPAGDIYTTERRRIVLSGERVDAVIAKVYNLSREESAKLFVRGLVFVNGKEISSPSHKPRENDKISVRGYGRFIYVGTESTTKRGRLGVAVDVYV